MNLKLAFKDFWRNFNEENNFLINLLKKHYNIELSDNPDYLIYSVYGNEHLQFADCTKILFTGENSVPDFNQCDYALGFHYLSFEDRYLRYPLYILYPAFSLVKKDLELNPAEMADRKFCNFVYSNSSNADPTRENFYR